MKTNSFITPIIKHSLLLLLGYMCLNVVYATSPSIDNLSHSETGIKFTNTLALLTNYWGNKPMLVRHTPNGDNSDSHKTALPIHNTTNAKHSKTDKLSSSNQATYAIRLLGDAPYLLLKGNNFTDPGYEIYDTTTNNAVQTGTYTDDGGFDKDDADDYYMDYDIEYGGDSYYATRIVRVLNVDIQLIGLADFFVSVGGSYIDLGTNIYNNENNRISTTLSASSDLDSNPIDLSYQHDHIITYTFADSAGNTINERRTVHVTDVPVPVFNSTANPYWILEGTTFNDPGAKVYDADGNLLTTVYATNTGDINSNSTGTYRLNYEYNDGNGNTTYKQQEILVGAFALNDNSGVNDKHNGYLPKGQAYNPIYQKDGNDNQLIINVGEEGSYKVVLKRFRVADADLTYLNINNVGTGQVRYNITDSQGTTQYMEYDIEVIDNPTVEYMGNNPYNIIVGNTFSNLVVKGFIKQSNGTEYVSDRFPDDYWTNPVSTTVENTYSYNGYEQLYDVNGSINMSPFVVNVVDPRITLTGTNPLPITQGETFTDPGATLSDAGLGVLSGTITANNGADVDTNTPGTYTLNYVYTDSKGNTTTPVTRTVTVVADTTPPTPPVVTATTTNAASSPVITGTYTSETGGELTVTFNSITYDEANSALVLDTTSNPNTWVLTVPTITPELTEGTYEVTATYTDAAGNAANDTTSNELTIDTTAPAQPTINAIVDNTTLNPTITGTWDYDNAYKNDVSIKASGEATEAAGDATRTFTVFNPTKLTGAVNSTGISTDASGNWTLDLSLVDSYSLSPDIDYTVEAKTFDLAQNESEQVTPRSFTFYPLPTISLNAGVPNPYILFVGNTFTDPVTAIDGEGNPIDDIERTGTFDNTAIGNYVLRYQATDTNGALSLPLNLEVKVVGPPVLNGDDPHVYFEELDKTFIDPKAEVKDLYGNLVAEVPKGTVTGGPVFTVPYPYTDSAGNTESIDRVVIKAQPPSLSDTSMLYVDANFDNTTFDHGVSVVVNSTDYTQYFNIVPDISNIDFSNIGSTSQIVYNVIDSQGGESATIYSPLLVRDVTVVNDITDYEDTDGDGAFNIDDYDDDGDGILDVNDPNPREAVALDDTLTAYKGQENTVNVLDNDDFKPIPESTYGVTITYVDGGSLDNRVDFSQANTTGEISYTPTNDQLDGTTIYITYRVRANMPEVGYIGGTYKEATLVITIGDILDTDGDGVIDIDDIDDDGDGIVDADDPEPLTFSTLRDDNIYFAQNEAGDGSLERFYDLTENDDISKDEGVMNFVDNTEFFLRIPSAVFEAPPIFIDGRFRLYLKDKTEALYDLTDYSYDFTYKVCVPNGANGLGGGCSQHATVTINFVLGDLDTDGDGNPDATDDHPEQPTAINDVLEAPYGQYADVDILANDDFLISEGTRTTTIERDSSDPGTAAGIADFAGNGTSGEFSYAPSFNEIGETVTFNYKVCNRTDPSNIVCATATLTIQVTDVIDTDGDGDPDITDPDDDNDGNPDDTDSNPLVATGARITPSSQLNPEVKQTLFDNILSSTDFLNDPDITITRTLEIEEVGDPAQGIIDLDSTTGKLEYTPLAIEAGKTINIAYNVCNTGVSPNVCANIYIVAIVGDLLDTDGDGVPDITEQTNGTDLAVATVTDDEYDVPIGIENKLYVLDNDDFIPQDGTTIEIISAIRTGISPNLGTFKVENNEYINYSMNVGNFNVGAEIKIIYKVCHTTGVTEVCGSDGEITINIKDKGWMFNTDSEAYHLNNVGIGTNNPEHALDIVGTTQTNDLIVGDSNHPLIETFEEDHYMIVDGHLHVSDPNDTTRAARWADKYDDYLLWVDGGMVSKDMAFADVEEGDWSDFVFKDNYKLPSLENIETHIKEHGHLHTMPSVANIIESGYRQKDINKRMLQTIEELTLHIIEQDKKIKAQSNQEQRLNDQQHTIEIQNERIEQLIKRLNAIETSLRNKK